jgi:hypothetical protein
MQDGRRAEWRTDLDELRDRRGIDIQFYSPGMAQLIKWSALE